MQKEKYKCKVIQWKKKCRISCSHVFLIPNQKLNANEDRERYELPRSIHWHRGSARNFPGNRRDVGMNCINWITCPSLEIEFIKHLSIFESHFPNLQFSPLTPVLRILNIIFYTCGLALLHFYVWKVQQIESCILDFFHHQTSNLVLLALPHPLKDAQYLPLQNTKSRRPSFTLV